MDTDERDSGRWFVMLSIAVDVVLLVSLFNAFVVVWKSDVVNLCRLQIMSDVSLFTLLKSNLYLSGTTVQ